MDIGVHICKSRRNITKPIEINMFYWSLATKLNSTFWEMVYHFFKAFIFQFLVLYFFILRHLFSLAPIHVCLSIYITCWWLTHPLQVSGIHLGNAMNVCKNVIRLFQRCHVSVVVRLIMTGWIDSVLKH